MDHTSAPPAVQDSNRFKKLQGRLEFAILVIIIVSVIALILSTVEPLYDRYEAIFIALELVSMVVFTIEYIVRLIYAPALKKGDNPIMRRLRYTVTPSAIIDLIAILPFYLPLILPTNLMVLRILRLARLARVLKLARYSQAMGLIGQIIAAKREELVVCIMTGGILLLFASTVMYTLENHAQPEVFASIPDALWWAVVTLTTVGYGDIYPITPLGRICGAITAVVCVGLFALPAGILASGFSEALGKSKQERQAAEIAQTQTCPHCGKPLDGSSHPQP